MSDFPPFPGFQQKAFDFLTQLKANNNRDWFNTHKPTYQEEIQWVLRCLVMDVAQQLAPLNIPLIADPKKSLFRIYRDTRFSKNKTPYKTNVGAILSRNGTNKDMGILYIHLEPENCFIASGFYQPDNTFLQAWRTRLTDTPETFLAIKNALERENLTLSTTDALKRTPRGFESYATAPYAEYLKWKSFLVVQPIPDTAAMQPSFTDTLVALAQKTTPLLRFGWEILDH